MQCSQFCKDCETLVCSLCCGESGDHKDHNLQSIEAAVSKKLILWKAVTHTFVLSFQNQGNVTLAGALEAVQKTQAHLQQMLKRVRDEEADMLRGAQVTIEMVLSRYDLRRSQGILGEAAEVAAIEARLKKDQKVLQDKCDALEQAEKKFATVKEQLEATNTETAVSKML